MNISASFPLRYFLNLGCRENERHHTEDMLQAAGISANRFPAIDLRRISSFQVNKRRFYSALSVEDEGALGIRGYKNNAEYAKSISYRLIIRQALQLGAVAALIIEDDVCFHPNFEAIVSSIKLPHDWGLFYFGCTHLIRPNFKSGRIVEVANGVDTFAFAIERKYYTLVLRLLSRKYPDQSGPKNTVDGRLADLHAHHSTYACFPNVAWRQPNSRADLDQQPYSEDGQQLYFPDAIKGLLTEMIAPQSESRNLSFHSEKVKEHGGQLDVIESDSKNPKVAFLFLTKGDVNHPQIWEEYLKGYDNRYRIFSHAKFPDQINSSLLTGSCISSYFQTCWGEIGLVHATRGLLLEALGDSSLTHFVLLSESCVPTRPYSELLRNLKIDPRPRFNFKKIEETIELQSRRVRKIAQVPLGCWRFQSQWWLMDRTSSAMAAQVDFTALFESMEVPDEAYFATVLSMQGYPMSGNVLKREITWTDWKKTKGRPTEWITTPPEILCRILDSGCFFARKFPKQSDIAKYGLHRSFETQPF